MEENVDEGRDVRMLSTFVESMRLRKGMPRIRKAMLRLARSPGKRLYGNVFAIRSAGAEATSPEGSLPQALSKGVCRSSAAQLLVGQTEEQSRACARRLLS